MYIPAHFAVRDDAGPLFDLIEANAFGLLLSHVPAAEHGGFNSSHIPFLAERPGSSEGVGANGRLLCHLAAANGHAEALDGCEVLCVFQGPHGYISPRWYLKKPAVPTWNYMVAHVYGTAKVTRDPVRVRQIVDRLSAVYEPAEGGWRLGDEPDSYVNGVLRAIVGVEIEITRLEGKFKLNQHRPNDTPGVVAALRSAGGDANAALADAMEQAAPRK